MIQKRDGREQMGGNDLLIGRGPACIKEMGEGSAFKEMGYDT